VTPSVRASRPSPIRYSKLSASSFYYSCPGRGLSGPSRPPPPLCSIRTRRRGLEAAERDPLELLFHPQAQRGDCARWGRFDDRGNPRLTRDHRPRAPVIELNIWVSPVVRLQPPVSTRGSFLIAKRARLHRPRPRPAPPPWEGYVTASRHKSESKFSRANCIKKFPSKMPVAR
jgi:hypothetical protein